EKAGGGIGIQGAALKMLVLEKIPLLLLALVSFASSLMMQPEHTTFISTTQAPMGLRVSNALVSYVKYMGKLLWPFDLGVPYPYPTEVLLWKVLASVVLLAGMTILAVRLVSRRPYVLVGWLWFLGALVPFLGIIQSGLWPEMADRYAYLTFIGLFIAMAWGLPDLLGSGRARLGEYAVFVMIGIAFVMSGVTRVQVSYWKDSISLFEHVLELNPGNTAAHHCISAPLLKKGEIDRAIMHMTETLRIKPDSVDTIFNLAWAYYEKKEYDKALGRFQQALKYNPGDAEIYNAMGNVLEEKGEKEGAVQYYKEAGRINPRDFGSRMNLGNLMMKSGKIDEAVFYYNEALKIDGRSPEAHNNIGIAYMNKGDLEKARQSCRQAVSLNPGYTD
ncbi:tetratricopeptide repeat protein, partial [bacterium]|nr:tetratricopeptide repeat protein [bacterium]